MLDIRLMGRPEEIEKAIAVLRAVPELRILKVSDPRPNRGGSPDVRVYVSVEVEA